MEAERTFRKLLLSSVSHSGVGMVLKRNIKTPN